jgi:UDP-GlcNAc3NAcA epimerase
MYDAVLQYAELAEQESQVLEVLGLQPRGYALVTVHRADNADDPQRLRAIFAGLEEVARKGLPVVFPMHPRTRDRAYAFGLAMNDLRLIDPVSYLDMLVLEKNARVILTDSGGVQKEAFFFRVPCVTLREETEWVETVEAGWNVLVGCEAQEIVQAAFDARAGEEGAFPYGDGRAAERMIRAILSERGPRNQ